MLFIWDAVHGIPSGGAVLKRAVTGGQPLCALHVHETFCSVLGIRGQQRVISKMFGEIVDELQVFIFFADKLPLWIYLYVENVAAIAHVAEGIQLDVLFLHLSC